jgi:hypothetical protein
MLCQRSLDMGASCRSEWIGRPAGVHAFGVVPAELPDDFDYGQVRDGAH